MTVEPIAPTTHDPPQSNDRNIPSSFQLAQHMTAQSTPHDFYSWLRAKMGYFANTSLGVRLSARKAQLTKGLKSLVNYTSRTYRYLKAAREYERAVQRHADTIGYTAQRQKLVDFMGGTTLQAHATSLSTISSTRTTEIKMIADEAALRYEDVPELALKLERIVRRAVRFNAAISKMPWRYVKYQWRRLLMGFWREKLVIGLSVILKGCVWDAGMGECWPVMGWVLIFLLLGPIYLLVDGLVLTLKRWWVSVVVWNQVRR